MSKLIQAINLGIGFFIGQGLYFFANLKLTRAGALDVVGELGILLGVLSLFQWVGDGGGVLMLGRIASEEKLKEQLCSFFFARALIVLLFFCFIFVIYYFFGQRFELWVWAIAISCGFVWSLNIAGLLDFYSLNRSIAWGGNINWVVSALAVIYFGKNVDKYFVMLGFLIGGIGTVSLQWWYLLRNNYFDFDFVLQKKIVNKYFWQFFWFNFGYSASQIYARLVPVIVSRILGVEMAGVVVFSKSVVNAVGQGFVFLRRVSFSDTVNLLRNNKVRGWAVLVENRIALCFVFFISAFSVFVFIWSVLVFDFGVVVNFICCLLVVNFVWAVGQIFSVVLVAFGFSKTNTAIVSLASVLGIGAVWLLSEAGIYYLVLVEFVVCLVVLFGAYFSLRNKEIIHA